LVERIEEFKLGFEPSFERFFGEEIFPVSGLLVKRKEGLVLLTALNQALRDSSGKRSFLFQDCL